MKRFKLTDEQFKFGLSRLHLVAVDKQKKLMKDKEKENQLNVNKKQKRGKYFVQFLLIIIHYHLNINTKPDIKFNLPVETTEKPLIAEKIPRKQSKETNTTNNTILDEVQDLQIGDLDNNDLSNETSTEPKETSNEPLLTNTNEDALSSANDIQGEQFSNEPVMVIDSKVELSDVSLAIQSKKNE